MGIIRQGILGGFRNKTGSVVGAYWRKLNVIKGLPRKSSKPPTQLQVDQRTKFGLVTTFLSWISELVDVGFKSSNGITNGMNEAVSYHLKNAITGTAPNLAIDYAKVRFSRGRLVLPGDLEVESVTPAKLQFSWLPPDIDNKFSDATDMATVMVYCPIKNKFVVLTDAAARSEMTYTLQLPGDFTGDMVHCYISFNSVKTKDLVSDSIYVGEVGVI